jgi:PAS domain S-box-containing protein
MQMNHSSTKQYEEKTETQLASELEHLRKKIAELEKAENERKQTKENQRSSEERYRTLFKLAADSILLIDPKTSEILEFNDSAHKNLGYSKEEFKKLRIRDLDVFESPDKFFERSEKLSKGIHVNSFETKQRGKDGFVRDVHVSGTLIEIGDRKYILSIWRDITERKKIENALRENEAKLAEQAKNLEETNTALKVLLSLRNEEKERTEENILSNVKQLINPYLKKLRHTGLNAEQDNLVNIVESNLAEITSSLTAKLFSKNIGLTPRELDVANLVKNGLTNQEIAETLCLSDNAVAFHRRNIRTKLGLKRKKVNLRSYLQNLSS